MSYNEFGQLQSLQSSVVIGSQYFTLFPDGNSALKAGYGSFYNDSSGQLMVTGPYGPLKVLDPTNVAPSFKGAGYPYQQNNILYIGGPAGPITVNQKNLAPPPPLPQPAFDPNIAILAAPGMIAPPMETIPGALIATPSSGSSGILILLIVAAALAVVIIILKKRKA